MKSITKNLTISKSFIIFICFFVLYFGISFSLSFLNDAVFKDYGIFFGSDCPRVYEDFLYINVCHYRLRVHPLQLIEIQPLIQIINGFLHSQRASFLVLSSLFGSAIVSFIYSTILNFTNKKQLSIIFSIIFGISFSTLIYVATPETYIFTTFFNVLNLLYASILFKNKNKIKLKDCFILALLSVLGFGIIPVSIISNLIIIFWIIVELSKNKKEIFLNFLRTVVLFLTIFFSLTLIQKLAYAHIPLPFEGSAKEEVNYLSKNVTSKKKIKFLIQRGIVSSFYPVKFSIHKDLNVKNGILFFDDNQKATIYFSALSLILFGIIGYFKNFKKANNRLILALSLIISISLIENYFYGTGECFLYTQNFLNYLIVLLAIFYSFLKDKISISLLSIYILYQTIMNFSALHFINDFIAIDSQKHYSFFIWLLYGLICGFVLYLFTIIYKKLIKNEILTLSTENKITLYSSLYLFFIVIACIFVALFHGRV